MLILARKEKESIIIDGGIEIVIQEISKDSVKIAIIAPKEVKVFRKELIDSVKSENINALKQLEKNQIKSYFNRVKKDNE
ncbi:MAG TPA: carbon storage regulator [Erysipelotrichaceae bacterium]|nr:carbon storage regulator [Erysipelotrichaceae bacterium]